MGEGMSWFLHWDISTLRSQDFIQPEQASPRKSSLAGQGGYHDGNMELPPLERLGRAAPGCSHCQHCQGGPGDTTKPS